MFRNFSKTYCTGHRKDRAIAQFEQDITRKDREIVKLKEQLAKNTGAPTALERVSGRSSSIAPMSRVACRYPDARRRHGHDASNVALKMKASGVSRVGMP
eukprot:COSAG02_NODE_6734_length_3394_cov_2.435508_2_plen_100_part_00